MLELLDILISMIGMDDIYKKYIEAYIDEELDTENEERARETISVYPTLQEYEEKVRKQNDLLKQWWASEKKDHH